MECVNCYELFDEERHVPVSLDCGHTFCRACVAELLRQRTKPPQCPMCRAPIASHVSADAFARNFAALEISAALREKRNLYEFCAVHSLEPERFFCSTCSRGVCANCLVEHSRHLLAPQEFSARVLRERLAGLWKWALGESRCLALRLAYSQERLAQARAAAAAEEAKLAEAARALLDKLQQDSAELRAQCREHVGARQTELRAAATALNEALAELSGQSAQLDEVEALLQKGVGCAKEKGVVERVEAIEARVAVQPACPTRCGDGTEVVQVHFNQKFEEELSRLGAVEPEPVERAVLIISARRPWQLYSVEQNEWRALRVTTEPGLEAAAFCTAHALSDRILMFAAGGSADVLQFDYHSMELTRIGQLCQRRIEHCSVRIDGRIFVIGGYDKIEARFLAHCEVYNIREAVSRPFQPMREAKCGFAAATLTNRIIVCGGFEGTRRLLSIEQYSVIDDTWQTLSLALPQPLAYHALVPIAEGQLLIVGGSTAEEKLSTSLYHLDVLAGRLEECGNMSEGQDARHSAVLFDDRLLLFGGEDCPARAYHYFDNKWSELASPESGLPPPESSVAVGVQNFPRTAFFGSDNEQFGASNLIGFDDSNSLSSV